MSAALHLPWAPQLRLVRKANPTLSDVFISRPLTTISVAYAQSADMFIAARAFPQVPVEIQAGQYWIFSRADWLRAEAKKRAPATESAGSGFRLSPDTYFAEKWSIHMDVDDETRANSAGTLDIDRSATDWVTHQLLLARETDWVNSFFVPGIWTSQTTPSPLWSAANSTPLADIRLRMDERQAATGFRPNKLIVSATVWSVLSDHVDLIERIKYTQGPAIAGPALLAQLLGLDEVLIASAVSNTGPEGGTEATNFMVGDHALLVYTPRAPSLLVPSAGYTFGWTGLLGAGAYAGRIKRFRLDELSSDRIEGDIAFDAKIVANELGHFFNQPIA